MKYDSKAEEKAAKFFEPLGYRRPMDYEYIEANLIDSQGQPFKAKVDFIPLDPLDCTVEYKPCHLNSKTTRAIADTTFKNAIYKRRPKQTDSYLEQLHAWSNSAYKHSIQHYSLAPLSHITVFDVWPSYKKIKLYLKLGILFCHISGFTKLNSYCRAAKLGLAISYTMRTPNGQEITFPLRSIQKWQSEKSPWIHKTAPKKEWEAAGFFNFK